MNQANLFNAILEYLWRDEPPATATPSAFIIRAIGDRLKGTARCNHENALDVRALVFPDSVCLPYIPDSVDRGCALLFDVKFADGSRALIMAGPDGIGSSVEPIEERGSGSDVAA